MKSKTTVGDHPLHPILVGFPIAYYTASFVGYSMYAMSADVFWFKLGYAANVVGVIFAVLAAVPGFIDWLYAIPKNSPAKEIGIYHLAGNVAALILFTANWWILSGQWDLDQPLSYQAVVVTGTGVVLTFIASYFGGELVHKHHVSIDTEKLEKLMVEEPKIQTPPRVS